MAEQDDKILPRNHISPVANTGADPRTVYTAPERTACYRVISTQPKNITHNVRKVEIGTAKQKPTELSEGKRVLVSQLSHILKQSNEQNKNGDKHQLVVASKTSTDYTDFEYQTVARQVQPPVGDVKFDISFCLNS